MLVEDMIAIGWRPAVSALGRAALHGQEHESPWSWSWEPSVVLGVGLLLVLYYVGLRRQRQRDVQADPAIPRQAAFFLAANLILLLALVSPLEVLSDEYLFSAHMVQHLLITMVVAPLWLLGTPGSLIAPLVRPRAILAVGRLLTRPALAILIFNANFWLWHLPDLYDLALADERVHIFQHLTFAATGVLNWWPVLSPLPALPRASYPGQLLYLAVNCQPNVVLGALFVFARGVLYTAYADAPRLFGLDLLGDQQLGGLIMWIPGNAIYLVVLSIVFFVWLNRPASARPDKSS